MEKDVFIDRQKHLKKMLIVLAGYKEVIWEKVFDRLIKYINDDIDVCVVTSGKQSESLMTICEQNNWSYMSTSINNLCLAQNKCIECFPDAEYIFKMDEDMFITKDVFVNLYNDYVKIKSEQFFVPSAIVPVINVNCISYHFLLRFAGLLNDFEKEVGFKATVTNGLHHHKEVLESPAMAKYMWQHFDIDKVKFNCMDWMPSPGRYSIGLVMFERSTWEDMGRFPVDLENALEYRRIGLGEDEKALCNYAMSRCKPLIIDFKSCVGHLAYGPQTKEMIEFYKNFPNYF